MALTNKQKNKAVRQLRFLFGKKGNKGKRRRQIPRMDITINGSSEAYMQQDEYDGLKGQGLIVRVRVVVGAETWEYCIHKGPDESKNNNNYVWVQIT